jgi:predicted DNA-binding protein with PD1-like motif
MEFFAGGTIERVIIASLTPGDLFLEGIEEIIKKENIKTGVITSGIGSFRKF